MGVPFEMALPPAAAANLGDAFHNAIAGQLALLKRPSNPTGRPLAAFVRRPALRPVLVLAGLHLRRVAASAEGGLELRHALRLDQGGRVGVCTEAVVRKGRLVGGAVSHAQVGPFGDQRQANLVPLIECCEKQGCVLYAQRHQCAPRERGHNLLMP